MSAKKEVTLLKVLVIHGYRQSGKSSREKTGSFRKGLKKYLDLVYITAPNKIPSFGDTESEEYGWWFSSKQNDNLSFNAKEESTLDDGHDEALKLIKKTFEEQGPFDGILGFSQGATMAAHVCSLVNKDDPIFKLKFAVLCAGFKSRSTNHHNYYEKQIELPTLHVYGDTDQVIPKEMSLELMEIFTQSSVLNHAGGHHLPASSKEKKCYQEFFEQFRVET